MLFYFMLFLMSVAGSVFLGAFVTASIMSILGKKYDFQLVVFSLWGLVFLFLAFVTRIVYLG